ncbi:fimbrial protein [Pantoea sp. 1.19]|uniref:fimbrial protein n=1 Tax=Pantoea sp. 1.19 TaxID=1925589 RepID=UPI000948A88E|nr:fimbrial protein [Pantoea sp. 1.19]
MKKIASLATVISFGGAIFGLHAADGTIQFTGNITDTACVVETASSSQTVALGTVASTAFSSAGSTAGAKPFTINLSNCPAAVTSAAVRFDGSLNTANSSILALNSGEDAANVGVAIYEQDSSTLIPIGSDSASFPLSASGINTLNFVAKYYATATPVGAGSANATASFTIAYN